MGLSLTKFPVPVRIPGDYAPSISVAEMRVKEVIRMQVPQKGWLPVRRRQ